MYTSRSEIGSKVLNMIEWKRLSLSAFFLSSAVACLVRRLDFRGCFTSKFPATLCLTLCHKMYKKTLQNSEAILAFAALALYTPLVRQKLPQMFDEVVLGRLGALRPPDDELSQCLLDFEECLAPLGFQPTPAGPECQ